MLNWKSSPSNERMTLAFRFFTFSNLQSPSGPPHSLTSSHLPWFAPISVPVFSQRWPYSSCGGVPHVLLLHVERAFCNLQFALRGRVLHSCSVSGALIFSFARSPVVCLLSVGWLSSSVPLQWIVNPWERRVANCKKKKKMFSLLFLTFDRWLYCMSRNRGNQE